jgi:hypothetical protein
MWTNLRLNPGHCTEKPTTNGLNCGMVTVMLMEAVLVEMRKYICPAVKTVDLNEFFKKLS